MGRTALELRCCQIGARDFRTGFHYGGNGYSVRGWLALAGTKWHRWISNSQPKGRWGEERAGSDTGTEPNKALCRIRRGTRTAGCIGYRSFLRAPKRVRRVNRLRLCHLKPLWVEGASGCKMD